MCIHRKKWVFAVVYFETWKSGKGIHFLSYTYTYARTHTHMQTCPKAIKTSAEGEISQGVWSDSPWHFSRQPSCRSLLHENKLINSLPYPEAKDTLRKRVVPFILQLQRGYCCRQGNENFPIVSPYPSQLFFSPFPCPSSFHLPMYSLFNNKPPYLVHTEVQSCCWTDSVCLRISLCICLWDCQSGLQMIWEAFLLAI